MTAKPHPRKLNRPLALASGAALALALTFTAMPAAAAESDSSAAGDEATPLVAIDDEGGAGGPGDEDDAGEDETGGGEGTGGDDEAGGITTDYRVYPMEYSEHSYFIVEEPILLTPGMSITIGAGPGFWYHGHHGGWDLTEHYATFFWLPPTEGYGTNYPLLTSVNEDGSVLTVTVPEGIVDAIPDWEVGYTELLVEASDGNELPEGSDEHQYMVASGKALLLTEVVVNPEATVTPGSAAAGSAVTVNGANFLADEELALYLHSTPVHLTTLRAAADGTFSVRVTIPANTAAGAHRIEVRGAESGSVWIPLTVTSAGLAESGERETVLFSVAAGLLLAGGAVVALSRRTRRS